MPTLHELQESFGAALMSGDPAAAEWIAADGLAPDARLNIYRNTYLTNLVGALRISYPAVRKLVGDEFFEGTARAYIDVHPARSAYLNDYGAQLGAFLASFPPAASLPYLADVARVEWAVNRALNAEDAPPLDPAKLQSLPADGNPSFVAHPSVSLVECAYPADEIWRAVIENDEAALGAIDPAHGRVFLVINRGPNGVAVARLSDEEWRFTQSLFASEPLARALAAVRTDMSSALAAHLVAGRISDVQERSFS
jgi:hypothetical protein